MTKIPFYTAGQIGLVKDITPHELPPQAWTDGQYIRFKDGKAIRRAGTVQRFPGHLGRPWWLMFAFTTSNAFWLYADETNMYATDGASHANVNHAAGAYSALDRARLWNGGILAGIPVITNGIEVPQAWTNINLSSDLIDLPNWPGSHRANLIRPFKQFLVAMVITRGGVTYPQMILWSHPAEPGALPISWDVADPTKLAGERDIPDEFVGGIRDGLAMRDVFVIYKDNSVWGMQFIGGQDVFRTYQILAGIGILGTHCVCAINKGTQHFFASSDDLIVFDGQNTQSVLDKRWKTFLSNDIDPGVQERSFVFSLERTNEAWFCYPQNGSEVANMALVWNWVENTLTQRPIPGGATSAALGPGETTGDPWDLDPAFWDTDATQWDLLQFRAGHLDILLTDPADTLGNSDIVQMGVGDSNDGVPYIAYLERTDIAFSGLNSSGEPKADFEHRKIGTRLWPRISGAPVQIKLGSHEDIEEPVVWAPAQTFTPGIDKYLDFEVNGLLLAIHIEAVSTVGEWTLHGYMMNVEVLGDQ